MGNQAYQVVVNGELNPDCKLEDATRSFSKLFNISTGQAAAIVGQRKIIKTNLAYNDARYYQQNIAATGVAAAIEQSSASDAPRSAAAHETVVRQIDSAPQRDTATSPHDHSSATATPPPAQQTMISNIDNLPPAANDAAASAGMQMVCFKCNHLQPRNQHCANCGHYIKPAATQTVITETAIAQNTTLSPTAAQDDDSVEPEQDNNEDDVFSISALPVPVAAAIAGALLWKYIAVTTGYEYGVIAWGIGGAIGFAAALAGLRGTKTGMVCGLLVALSMFGGKYMVYSSMPGSEIQAWLDILPEDAMNELRADHQEYLDDAELFAAIPHTDHSVKQFMVNRAYTEAERARDVSEEDLLWFREQWQDSLINLNVEKPDFNTWLEREYTGESNDDYSPVNALAEDLDGKDGLFLFFGIATAFRLVRGKEEQEAEEDEQDSDARATRT